jgi:hypothetical protein
MSISLTISTPSSSRILAMDEPFACTIGERLWLEYRARNPFGRQFPPTAGEDCTDPELAEYCDHVATCEDCNEV